MSRLLVLFVLAVSLATIGCGGGGDGEEAAADQLSESKFANQYLDADQDVDTDNDGELTEDEVLCSHPVFSTIEPFPLGGTTPPEVVTPPNSYWQCVDYDYSLNMRINADGTVNGRYTSGYKAVLDFWNICQVGPQPPEFSGEWIYYPDYEAVCVRDNILPGVIECVSFIYSNEAFLIHGGEIVDSYYYEDSGDCYLREE